MKDSVFNLEDWLVVALFAAVMIGIVLLSMRRKARTGADYFLSGRDSNWLQIGTSIFSSNIGSEHPRGPRRRRIRHRHGDGALGDPVLAHPGARLGVRAAL